MDEDFADVFVNKLIVKVAELTEQNFTLKNEVDILTKALRELQWRYDRLVDSMESFKGD